MALGKKICQRIAIHRVVFRVSVKNVRLIISGKHIKSFSSQQENDRSIVQDFSRFSSCVGYH